MSRPRKSSGAPPAEPSLRDKLSTAFLAAFESDFQVHGVDVITRLREKYPERYADIGARLIMATEPPPDRDGLPASPTFEDIARSLLRQIGVLDDAMTPSMIEAAMEANAVLVDKLEQIAAGH